MGAQMHGALKVWVFFRGIYGIFSRKGVKDAEIAGAREYVGKQLLMKFFTQRHRDRKDHGEIRKVFQQQLCVLAYFAGLA